MLTVKSFVFKVFQLCITNHTQDNFWDLCRSFEEVHPALVTAGVRGQDWVNVEFSKIILNPDTTTEVTPAG